MKLMAAIFALWVVEICTMLVVEILVLWDSNVIPDTPSTLRQSMQSLC